MAYYVINNDKVDVWTYFRLSTSEGFGMKFIIRNIQV